MYGRYKMFHVGDKVVWSSRGWGVDKNWHRACGTVVAVDEGYGPEVQFIPPKGLCYAVHVNAEHLFHVHETN